MSEPTYRVMTLGCRVNRADSLAIERQLAGRGFRRAEAGIVPDLWVVNTCAVTAEGMKKSRKAVRRCAASGARVIVTGCAVDLERDALKAEGVDSLFPNAEKERLVERVCGDNRVASVAWAPQDLVRVPVKVQDGCSRRCSYCIVPDLRPEPSCRGASTILEEIDFLNGKGAGEVIFCGIDLGSYRDPESGRGLDHVTGMAARASTGMWLRLSSIEFSDVDTGLVESMRAGELCRHLHLPMQSGDAGILKEMRRGYCPGEFRERVLELVESVPGLSISTDVMVGFPGESEAAFSNTAALVEELGFWRVHVFKYSRRPGTAAYDLADTVPPEEKQRRALALRRLSAGVAARFHAGQVGRIIPVLVEGEMQSEPGRLFGRAESFAGVVFEGSPALIGSRVRVRLISSTADGLRGELEETGGTGGGERSG